MSEGTDHVDPLVCEVAEFLDATIVLPPAASVVVAVSGGPDSVALLAVLRELAGQAGRQYKLTAAHLNHQLRPDAQADAEFVAALARQWSLPCVVEARDVADRARRLGQGIEQAARAVRYEFLREVAETVGAACVAVGHHADDNVETVVYRMFRGTHLRGLAGMPAVRELAPGGVRLIRPLLSSTREQIEAFCRRASLRWRTDPTNAQIHFRRNFIRHELLPMVRDKLNPRADEAVLRLAGAAGDVEALLAGRGRAALDRCRVQADGGCVVLSLPAMQAEHPVVAAYAIRAALEELAVPLRTVGADHFDELVRLLRPDELAAVSLPGRVVARRQGKEIIIGAAPEGAPAEVVTLTCPGTTLLPDGGEIRCEVEPFDSAAFAAHCAKRLPGVELIDADTLRGALTARPRRAGDAFVPLGAPGRQSVSDFLTNRKLPHRRRDEVLCICDELGIVYVSPLRIDQRVAVTKTTERVLRVCKWCK